MELFLFIEGNGTYTHNAIDYSICPKSVAICNSHSSHAENFTKAGGRFLVIGITGIKIQDFRKDHLISSNTKPIFYAPDQFDIYYSLAKMLFRFSKKKTSYAKENVSLLLKSLILQIFEESISNRVKPSSALMLTPEWSIGNQAKSFIARHFTEDLKVENVADAVQVSASYLAHIFKKETGLTIMQYVTRLRIGEAQTQLTDNCQAKISVTELSHMLGYNSSNNFYIAFKKNVGCSPSEYREYYHAVQEQI